MNNTQKALALAAVVLVALVGYKVAMRPDAPTEATPKQADTAVGAPVATAPAAIVKKLTTQVTYKEPAGESPISFTLSVGKDGVITDATAEVLAVHDVSKQLQTAFAAEFSAAVSGKKLSELTAIDRVGGASLTTKAFNDALATLKAQM